MIQERDLPFPCPKLQEWECHRLSQETVFKGWEVSDELV